MEPGSLRHVVTLEERVESQNETGEIVWTWQTWQDNVRASIEDLSAREIFAAAQVQADVSTRIRIRYRPGVTEKMRIRHVRESQGSPTITDYYDIEGITRDLKTARWELQLLCRRRSAEGFRSDGNG